MFFFDARKKKFRDLGNVIELLGIGLKLERLLVSRSGFKSKDAVTGGNLMLKGKHPSAKTTVHVPTIDITGVMVVGRLNENRKTGFPFLKR